MANAPTTYIVHGMYLGDTMLMFFATQDEAAQWINDMHEFSDGGEVNLRLASVVGIDYDAIDGDASNWNVPVWSERMFVRRPAPRPARCK